MGATCVIIRLLFARAIGDDGRWDGRLALGALSAAAKRQGADARCCASSSRALDVLTVVCSGTAFANMLGAESEVAGCSKLHAARGRGALLLKCEFCKPARQSPAQRTPAQRTLGPLCSLPCTCDRRRKRCELQPARHLPCDQPAAASATSLALALTRMVARAAQRLVLGASQLPCSYGHLQYNAFGTLLAPRDTPALTCWLLGSPDMLPDMGMGRCKRCCDV